MKSLTSKIIKCDDHPLRSYFVLMPSGCQFIVFKVLEPIVLSFFVPCAICLLNVQLLLFSSSQLLLHVVCITKANFIFILRPIKSSYFILSYTRAADEQVALVIYYSNFVLSN